MVEVDLVLHVKLENWGRGLAILDGMSLRDEDGRELVDAQWEVEMALLPRDEKSVAVSTDGLGDIPDAGTAFPLGSCTARYRALVTRPFTASKPHGSVKEQFVSISATRRWRATSSEPRIR